MRTQRVLGIIVLLSGLSLTANAQATRTWVSGVGDDANPCSRTAPCKTFAGAISKTAAGGEISVLDPGGFGALTITKSITIEGADFVSSVLSSATNGIVISAPSTAHVYLRNLTINGAGTTLGINGIRILSAASVTIEGCAIFDYSNAGIDIEPTAASILRVAVSDTSIRDVSGFGVRSLPTSGAIGNVFLSLDNVRVTGTTGNGVSGAGSAVDLDGGTTANIVNSVLSGNDAAGLFVRNQSNVSTFGVEIFQNGIGISVGDAGLGSVRLYGSSIYANSNGIAIISGTVLSHGNNAIFGNGGSQATSSNIGTQ